MRTRPLMCLVFLAAAMLTGCSSAPHAEQLAAKDVKIQELMDENTRLRSIIAEATDSIADAGRTGLIMAEQGNWESAWVTLHAAITLAHQNGEPSEYMAQYVRDVDAILKQMPTGN